MRILRSQGNGIAHRQTITANEIKIGSSTNTKDFEPIYAIKGNMTVKGIRRCIYFALSQFGEHIEETLPNSLRRKYKLINRKDAIRAMHFPNESGRIKTSTKAFSI